MDNNNEPVTLQLNLENSVQILAKYIELGQSKGVFKNLNDVNLFKRSIDVLVHKAKDNELNVENSINILSQGVTTIQGAGGVLTINDASILFNILSFLNVKENLEKLNEPKEIPKLESLELKVEEVKKDVKFDLTELSKPVPFKIRNV